MSIISLGPLMIRSDLFVLILSAAFGYLIFHLRLHGKDERTEAADLLINSFILGFLTWKFSLLLLHPVYTLSRPMSLLYYSGGEKGLWLAHVFAVVYIWRRLKYKQHLVKPYLQGGTLAYLSFRLAEASLLWGMEGTEGFSRPLGVILYAVLTGWAWFRFESPLKTIVNLGLWYCIGSVLLGYLYEIREPIFAGLSANQILFALLAVGLLLLDNRLHKPRR
ncbi:hypothetical protein [Gorillibacterium massiliense]|uniref:hypothetical protein n=1 Tax=Gorillibacterium massiliense TaxID=1280390 RepID=UPI0005937F81|nr:hypothetical protein [Gorillibacterium massiliense]